METNNNLETLETLETKLRKVTMKLFEEALAENDKQPYQTGNFRNFLDDLKPLGEALESSKNATSKLKKGKDPQFIEKKKARIQDRIELYKKIIVINKDYIQQLKANNNSKNRPRSIRLSGRTGSFNRPHKGTLKSLRKLEPWFNFNSHKGRMTNRTDARQNNQSKKIQSNTRINNLIQKLEQDMMGLENKRSKQLQKIGNLNLPLLTPQKPPPPPLPPRKPPPLSPQKPPPPPLPPRKPPPLSPQKTYRSIETQTPLFLFSRGEIYQATKKSSHNRPVIKRPAQPVQPSQFISRKTKL